MANPLEDVENKKGQQDMGVFAYRVWQGARQEGATFKESLSIVCAFFYGLFKANQGDDVDESQ